MPIIAYTGLPGSGKSYGVVANVLLPALDKGRRVWTNIPINTDTLDPEKASRLSLFTSDDVANDPQWFRETFSPGATIIIDECWRLWPSGLKANNMQEAHKSFLAEHRHMVGEDGFSTEIVLIVQDLQNIAAYPRSLVDKTYRAVKLGAIGQDKRFRLDIYEGAVTGNKPPEKQRLRQIYGKYEQEVYQHYKSQTMSESDGHGDESTTDKRANILNSPMFKIVMPLVALLCIFIVWYGLKGVSKMYGGEDEEMPVQTAELPQIEGKPGSPGKPEIPLPPKPEYNHFYKGKDLYIAFNMGKSPFVTYKIGFDDGGHTVVLDAAQLGKMGYRIIGYDSCYAILEGHGDARHVFCQSPEQKETASILKF